MQSKIAALKAKKQQGGHDEPQQQHQGGSGFVDMSDRVHGHGGAQQQQTSWYEHPTEKRPVQQQPSGNPLNEEIDLTKDQIDATK